VFWPLQLLFEGSGVRRDSNSQKESSLGSVSLPSYTFLGLRPWDPFALVASPRLGLRQNLISIGGLNAKLWGPKVVGVPTLGISGLPFGNPETKCHLDVGLVERYKVYYKGDGGDFPQVWAVVSLTNLRLPVAHLSTKSAPTIHSPTCCLVLCRFVWVIKCLSFFLVPSQSFSTPFYPQSAVN